MNKNALVVILLILVVITTVIAFMMKPPRNGDPVPEGDSEIPAVQVVR